MTVTYTADVASSSVGCYLKLLFRWRGSIYKLLWKEFLIFVLTYFTLSFIYRFAMNELARSIFERMAKYCSEFSELIPLAFVLGFYVSVVVSRWWEQFNKIPWPDRMAMFVTAHVHGHDDRARLMRRTIMRYLCLAFVITLHSISPGVKRRFPTFGHMTQAGFMLPNEQKIIEDIKTPHNKYFVPLAWTTSLVTRARKEGRIKDDFAVKTLIDEINDYRGCLGGLFNFDWISIPLVYTQVVTWASYTFFFSCLMGRQFIEGGPTEDVYIPVFTLLQFFFYMGWLKVAECMVNPFGDDDDDFDINSIIDRNLQVSYLVVDEMHSEHPELIRDQYWDDTDFELPYTAATASQKITTPHIGSAMDINMSPKDREFVTTESLTVIQEGEVEIEMENLAKDREVPEHFKHHLLRNDHHSVKVVRPQGLFHNMRRSNSSNTRSKDMLESPELMSRKTKRKRNLSESSQITSEVPTPTASANPEEIFQMSDLEGEDEVDPSTASTKSKLWRPDFMSKIANHFRSRSQKSLNVSQASKSPQLHDKKSTPAEKITKSRETLPLISESSPCTVKPEATVPANEDSVGLSSLGSDDILSADDATQSRRRHISQATENDTQNALEDLRFKQERDRGDNLPRAVSLHGQDVAHELGIDDKNSPFPLSNRYRTNSEGPKFGSNS